MNLRMNYPELMKAVIKEVLQAGELLSAEWQLPSGPRGAGDKADVDIEIEKRVRASLLRLFDCDYWGEETGSVFQGVEHCWVVDPNDGTVDFLSGLKGSAISIGLLFRGKPVLGVVYAPVTVSCGPDCIAWAYGMDGIYRNGQILRHSISGAEMQKGTRVLVSTAALKSLELNALLCAPAVPVPTTSIAYRLAAVAAGDAIAGISLVPTSAHDLVAGHALLIGAGGILIDENGDSVTYEEIAGFTITSKRCFGGAASACHELVLRDWEKLFRHNN